MQATLLIPTSPTSRQTRTTTKRRKAVPAARVRELLRELVIALHATRPVGKAE